MPDQVVKEVKAVISAENASEDAIKQFETRIDQMKAHVASAGHQAGESFIENLKSEVGRSSAAHELIEIFRGAGPAIAIGLAAHETKELAEGFEKAVDEFREGKITTGEMADQLARSIPILGDIYSAGRAIREIFTGEEAAIAAINEQAERLDKLLDSNRDKARELAAYFRQTAEHRYELGPTLSPTAKDQLSNSDALRDKTLSENQDFHKTRGDLGAELSKAQAAARDEQAYIENLKKASIVSGGAAASFAAPLAHAASERQKVDNEKVEELNREFQVETIQHEQRLTALKADAEKTRSAIAAEARREQEIKESEHRAIVLQIERDGALESNRISAEADVERLRASGRDFDAQVAQVRAGLTQQEEQIDANARKEIETYGDINVAEQKAHDQKIAAATKAGAEIDGLNEQARRRAADSANELTHNEAEVHAEKLRRAGKAEEANAVLEADKTQKTKEEIEKRRLAAIAGGISPDQANSNAQRETALAAQRDQLELEDKQKQLADQRASIGDHLMSMKIDELKLTGSIGEQEQKRFAVAMDYLHKAQELRDIINDKNASAAQKQDAQSELAKLPGEEQQALAIAGRTKQRGTAEATNAGALHGIIESSRTQAEKSPEAKLLDETAKGNKAAEAKLGNIESLMSQLVALVKGTQPVTSGAASGAKA